MATPGAGNFCVFAGPVGSGKTARLLQEWFAAGESSKRGLFRPFTACHDASELGAAPVFTSTNTGVHVTGRWVDPGLLTLPLDAYELLLIDDAHQLTSTALKELQRRQLSGCALFLAGQDLTHKGDPYGMMPFFCAVATKVVKCFGRCVLCGQASTRTQRLLGTPANLPDLAAVPPMGGSGTVPIHWESRCIFCFEPSRISKVPSVAPPSIVTETQTGRGSNSHG